MKKFILILLIAGFSISFGQTKYLIYFKDKNISPSSSLQKSSSSYKIAEQSLSQKAIERRKQIMGEDNYITYEDLPISSNYISQLESIGTKIENQLKWFNAVSSYLTDEQVSALSKLSFVEKIEGVRTLKKISEENLIDFGQSSFLKDPLQKTTSRLDYGPSLAQNALCEIPAVHDLKIDNNGTYIDGSGAYIGILDNGFNWKTQGSLKYLNVAREYNYVTKTTDVRNSDYHGTAVFSLMAGNFPSVLIGPAYGAKFFLAKTEVDGSETHSEEDNYAAALQEMESAGVDITSSSLGYDIFDSGGSYTYSDMNGNTTIVAKAINLAFNFGVFTFTAAGNSGATFWGIGKGGLGSPADAFNVITVGAINADQSMGSYSSRGPTSDGRIKPEIVAQGTYPQHATADNGYGNGGFGTSYATPIAAGVGALLKSCWPHLTNLQMRKIFLESGDNSANPNNDKGWGLISAKKAISYPNLSSSNGVFNKLNKIFINANGVNSSTVRINYSISGGSFQNSTMNYDGILKYYFNLPSSLTNGNMIEFYFTYQDNSGVAVREPSITNSTFKMSFGSYNINNLTSVEDKNEIPSDYSLYQNYPNPFNPSTVISYLLPTAGYVSLKVFDVLGREVTTLVEEYQNAGFHHSIFNIQRSTFSSGVYFYRLQAGKFIDTKKMVLVK